MADDRVALVKQASDIVEVVGAYVHLQAVGGKFKGLCPFHEDHRPSLDVDPRFQNFRCWACGKHGDVLTFIQERERVDFRDALQLLARRAGISLQPSGDDAEHKARARMLDVIGWAADLYHNCLLDSPVAETARRYLGERGLLGETVRQFSLGFAPGSFDWLVSTAERAGIALDVLVQLGLIAARDNGRGYYDRFRDRIMFPIRNPTGQTVAFGGRILPGSPSADRGPKYYNSCETPLFVKSEHLYGLDRARQEAAAKGYLAVVEGYMDVLMAHQAGIVHVAATLGTALNERHVRNIRRYVPRVVLVFDADAGGRAGVDRALEVFVSHDVDLAIATLPAGLDPCDLIMSRGAEPFRQILSEAKEALEFKLAQVLDNQGNLSIEGRRRAADDILNVIALAPEMAGTTGAIKRQLMVTRITQRLALKEEDVWKRLKELRERGHGRPRSTAPNTNDRAQTDSTERVAPAPPEEIQLLQILLAAPALVPVAAERIKPEALMHPGLRQLLTELYSLEALGLPPTLDHLRERIDNIRLMNKAAELQSVGLGNPEPALWLQKILAEFDHKRRIVPEQQELKNRLHATSDHDTAVTLLRRLQEPSDLSVP